MQCKKTAEAKRLADSRQKPSVKNIFIKKTSSKCDSMIR